MTPKLMAKNLAGVFPTYQSMLRSWPGLTGMFDNAIVPWGTLSEFKRNHTVSKYLFNEHTCCPYSVGAGEKMEIIAKVDNEGEEAFNARLYVQVHSLAFQ